MRSNTSDYMQLCPSCHRKYDFNPESAKRIGLKQKGIPKEFRMRYVMRLSEDDHYTYLDISKAAKENKISRTGIANCLSGLTKTAGGYKWIYRL